MEIYERIKNRRESLNLSIRQVADALGVAPSTVMRYETSDIKNMGIDKVSGLAEVLKCSPAYILGWENETKTIVEKFERLDASDKNAVNALISALLSNSKYQEDAK